MFYLWNIILFYKINKKTKKYAVQSEKFVNGQNLWYLLEIVSYSYGLSENKVSP